MTHSSFPDDFYWGTSTAAYQIEGAWNLDGKGPSVWDEFTHQPGHVIDHSNADVSCDHYHHWEHDLDLIKDLGLKMYRFSIAWSRVLPDGTGAVNEQGIDFYRKILQGCMERGITPMVTLYHWDLPLALQQKGGICAKDFSQWFLEYACLIADRLGEYIPYLASVNQPYSVFTAHLGASRAPATQSIQAAFAASENILCAAGMAAEELHRSHPAIKVGIILNRISAEPFSAQPEDQNAARLFDMLVNRMYEEAVFHGRYPDGLLSFMETMKVDTGNYRKEERRKLICSPLDFVGMNYYHRMIVQASAADPLPYRFVTDPQKHLYTDGMREIYPKGMLSELRRLHQAAPDLPIFITESGADYRAQSLHDPDRIVYLREHITILRQAIEEGIPVRGYLLWTLMDNFEWENGYQGKYGIYAVTKERKRLAKDSAMWYKEIVSTNGRFL